MRFSYCTADIKSKTVQGGRKLTNNSSAVGEVAFLLVEAILSGEVDRCCCEDWGGLKGSRKGFLETGRGGGSSKGE